tara:strand:+ start:691 stop:840 length:150 start_codon:yes stop_codon:yes gene_type:complete
MDGLGQAVSQMSTHAADHWRKENKDMDEVGLQDHDISGSPGSNQGIIAC